MTSTVWIVTKHEEFATPASRQLATGDCVVQTLSAEQATQNLRSKDSSPVVALVDCDAKTREGSLLHQTIRNTLPRCQIVLICTPGQASEAARLAISGDAWDYLLTDSARDPNRVLLVVERARADMPNGQNQMELQHGRILQTLRELRDILKGGGNHPIADVLNKFKVGDSADLASEALPEELAQGYENCLVELICGRLRRLENQIFLLGNEETRLSADPDNNQILLVEDSHVCAELAKGILESAGFEVVVANSALAAKSALSEHLPALVLMDVHLGDANGLELVKLMRAGSTCPNLPVIVITADRMRETLLHAVGVNIQGYLLKPYEPRLLIEKVKAVLERPRGEALTAAQPDRAPDTQAAPS